MSSSGGGGSPATQELLRRSQERRKERKADVVRAILQQERQSNEAYLRAENERKEKEGEGEEHNLPPEVGIAGRSLSRQKALKKRNAQQYTKEGEDEATTNVGTPSPYISYTSPGPMRTPPSPYKTPRGGVKPTFYNSAAQNSAKQKEMESYLASTHPSSSHAVPGLAAQQGAPDKSTSASHTIPSAYHHPSLTTPRNPEANITEDEREELRWQRKGWHVEEGRQMRRAAARQQLKKESSIADPLGNDPDHNEIADETMEATPASARPPGGGGGPGGPGGSPGAPGGGGTPPGGPAPGSAEGGEGGPRNEPTYMHGEHPNPSGKEGHFKTPTNREPIGTLPNGLPDPNAPPPRPGERRQGEGEYVPPPYGDGSAFAEKAREGDSDRLDPITPASGSKQTPATANSLVSATQLEENAKKKKPEEVLGNAEERANMGKGAFSGYEFAGPYDYPSYPSGRRDTHLTAMGAWRSKTGEHSASLWSSKVNARGQPAKREKFYKWSTKGGGNWGKLSSNDAMRVMTKNQARKNGARWMSQPNPGGKLTDLMSATLKRKMEDINMGKAGNARMNKRKKGADPVGNHQVQM